MANLLDSSQLPTTPQFIDTASCRCALQDGEELNPIDGNSTEAWRCIGNSTENIYQGSNGKWFLPINPPLSSDLDESLSWGGNPPDTESPYIDISSDGSLVPYDMTAVSQLSLVDQACTGKNDTKQSSQYYAQIESLKSGGSGASASPCLQTDADPITIQNATSWNETGCSLGFYC